MMLVVAGCAKENVQNNLGNPIVNEEPAVEWVETTVSANVTTTKTSVESDGTYNWENGDAINVFTSDGTSCGAFTTAVSKPGSSADFTGTVPAGKTPKYAVYPYNANATCTPDGVISTVIPTEQDGTIASALSCATSTDGKNFTFTNATSVIKLNFNASDNICAVAVQFKDNVTGAVSLNCETGIISGATSKIVSVKGNSAFDGPVYLAIAPAEQKEIVLTFTNLDGQNAMLNASVKNGFAAGSIKSLGTVSDLTFKTADDLSAEGTANCYIVPAEGVYRFKASVKGNSTTDIITPASVEYLWSTFNTATAPNTANEIVKAVSLGADGYATFETTGVSGNVIVAAKDAKENIIWSWHLWCCAGIADVVHQNATNKLNGQTMLDRNLGALSNHWSDDNVDDFGFFYQWGRKDPFVSASIRTTNKPETIPYAAVHGLQKAFSGGKKTVEYSIANPTTFINPSEAGDWLPERDNTLWAVNKTIYDPCPVGYAMPTTNSGPWGFFSTYTTWESTYKGRYFTNRDNVTVWHPALGFLYCTSGKYSVSNNSLGVNGKYWSYNLGDYVNTGKAYRWHEEASTCSLDGEFRASGIAVRCQKK